MREAGVWIDHRKAVIAILAGETEQRLQVAKESRQESLEAVD